MRGRSDQQLVPIHAEEDGHTQEYQVQDRRHGGRPDVFEYDDVRADAEETESRRAGHAAKGPKWSPASYVSGTHNPKSPDAYGRCIGLYA